MDFLKRVAKGAREQQLPYIAVADIPLRTSEADEAVLAERCQPLFYGAQSKTEVVIIDDQGFVHWNFKDPKRIVEFYREHRIRSVHALPSAVVTNLVGHFR